MAMLNVWMNGELVGEWTANRSGNSIFRYARTWIESPHARAISLSLPLTADREIRGSVVDHYFDNLLPDNPDIRRRIRDRLHLRTAETFDLLAAIGRDCIGAVQLLSPDETAAEWNRIDALPLSNADVERILRNVTAPSLLGQTIDGDAEFRISIAGAQEKTALLHMGNRWYLPRGMTPTTHILKLPLGLIGSFRGDFSHSVENECLCSRLLGQLGLPVAETRIATFGAQKALVVRRFDRRWVGADVREIGSRGYSPPKGVWIARLPQEDFCQATGRSPSQRYESDGGASMNEILNLLSASASAEADRAQLVLAQLAFWLLAATDGHSKNFSIHLQPGGAFSLTPLYDVLSAWPVIGRGANRISLQEARLAMAVAGRNKHYRLQEIQARHWHDLAIRVGGLDLWHRVQHLVDHAPAALDSVAAELPTDFPEMVTSRIRAGMEAQRARFLAGVAGR